MKKLAVVAVLLLMSVGCYPHCTDTTIFGGCKDRCVKNRKLTCDCNHRENCCEKKISPATPE